MIESRAYYRWASLRDRLEKEWSLLISVSRSSLMSINSHMPAWWGRRWSTPTSQEGMELKFFSRGVRCTRTHPCQLPSSVRTKLSGSIALTTSTFLPVSSLVIKACRKCPITCLLSSKKAISCRSFLFNAQRKRIAPAPHVARGRLGSIARVAVAYKKPAHTR